MIVGAAALLAAAPAFAGSSAADIEPATTPQPLTASPASPPPAGQPMATLAAPMQQNILRAGTEVPLRTREDLTTEKKKLRVGQRVQLEVATNVEMNGVTVIPAGTPAVAEITEVRNKGMWGKSGYINCRVISLRLSDRTIRLSGTFDDKGVTGTAGVVGAVAFVPIAGFFMTGTSAKIPSGSGTKGFLDEDIAFQVAVPQSQVLEVPAAATAVSAAQPAASVTKQ